MTMKIIPVLECYSIYENPDDKFNLYSRNSSANIRINDNKLYFYEYGKSILERTSLFYNGEEYKIVCTKKTEPSIIDFPVVEDGTIIIKSLSGKELYFSPEIKLLLIYKAFSFSSEYIRSDDVIMGALFKYDQGRTALAIANLETSEIKTHTGLRITPILLADKIVGFDRKSRRFLCLDFDLKTIWSFNPEEKITPAYILPAEVYKDIIIQNFGPTHSTESPMPDFNGIPQADKVHHYDDSLYALSQLDGHVVWKMTIPKCIDSMQVYKDKLYLCSVNEIHQIDIEKGNILNIVDTELSDDYSRARYKSSLHIQNEYLYFCHPADRCLLIYSLTDFQLLRRIDIPLPYTIKSFEYCHEASGKLYFELGPSGGKEYYHMSPALELDPGDLTAEIEIDNGPDVDIQLKSAPDNPQHQELWVTIKDVPLDEALVYGEMHTENQAYYHAYQGPQFHTIHHSENFNGIVHFRYSGSEQPNEEIQEKMAIMTQRFNDWAAREAFACTDRSKAATLDAQYLE